MNNYTLFFRASSNQSPRVRWHKFEEIKAASRPDALRRAVEPRGDYVIDRNTVAVVDQYGDLVMVERSDRVDFDHYDYDGSYVESTRVDA